MIQLNLQNNEGDTSYEVFGTNKGKVYDAANKYDLVGNPSFESVQKVLDAEDIDINTKLWYVFTAGLEAGFGGGYLPIKNKEKDSGQTSCD